MKPDKRDSQDKVLNVRIDPDLHRRLKIQSAREAAEFRVIIARALEAELARCESPTPRPAG